jgi:hypothetical protein
MSLSRVDRDTGEGERSRMKAWHRPAGTQPTRLPSSRLGYSGGEAYAP